MPRKAKKTWPPKFKTGLTPISRLRHYKSPQPMVGYPHSPDWKRNSQLVYDAMIGDNAMLRERGWTNTAWETAHQDNRRLDQLIAAKWGVYDTAWDDHIFDYLMPEAERDNAAWNYEYENYIAA